MTKYNMSIDTARVMLSALTQIKRNVTKDNMHYGCRALCGSLESEIAPRHESGRLSVYVRARHELFYSWPEFSGRLHYPIGPNDDEEECERLWDARLYQGRSFWDRRNDYCKARWRLLDWMISECRRIKLHLI